MLYGRNYIQFTVEILLRYLILCVKWLCYHVHYPNCVISYMAIRNTTAGVVAAVKTMSYHWLFRHHLIDVVCLFVTLDDHENKQECTYTRLTQKAQCQSNFACPSMTNEFRIYNIFILTINSCVFPLIISLDACVTFSSIWITTRFHNFAENCVV